MPTLSEVIEKKLDAVNCVTMKGEVFYKHDYHRWVKNKAKPEVASDLVPYYELIKQIASFPHETRKTGSVLVVTPLDPLKV